MISDEIKETDEVLEANPNAAANAPGNIEILEGNGGTIHGIIAEDQIVCNYWKNEQI